MSVQAQLHGRAGDSPRRRRLRRQVATVQSRLLAQEPRERRAELVAAARVAPARRRRRGSGIRRSAPRPTSRGSATWRLTISLPPSSQSISRMPSFRLQSTSASLSSSARVERRADRARACASAAAMNSVVGHGACDRASVRVTHFADDVTSFAHCAAALLRVALATRGVRHQGSARAAAHAATARRGQRRQRAAAPPPSRAVERADRPARCPQRAARRRTMSAFALRDGELHAEGVPLAAIAERFGTPCYVYSRAALEGAYPRVRRGVRGRRRTSSATR